MTQDDAGPDDELLPAPRQGDSASSMGRRHVRGSLLLLFGRLLSLFLTVATQVVIVRALSKADYGVFAYAFTLVASGRILLSLGQGRLLSRFMSTYEEERDYPRMFGSMFLAAGTIMVTSTLFLGALALFAEPILGATFDDPGAVDVLLVLMFLAPMEALDQVFVSLFAVFSRPQAIFFRKYLVTPGLRLGVVVAIAVFGGTIAHLAIGYVLTSLVGIGIYAALLVRMLRERGILHHFQLRRVVLPFKAVFSFSIPTMTSELVVIATSMGSVVLLGAFWGAREVAELRAVLPAARLNQVVYQTFLTLFLPMAARLFARGNHQGVRETYWHSSIFLAVSTFPVFIMTTVFASVTTVTLFGERYSTSGTVLMALSVGYYFSVALGFNAFVLQVYGRLRYLVLSNIGVAVVNLSLAFILIPKYGALGAAVANGATMIGQNIVNQVVLNRIMRATGRDSTYRRPALVICAGTAALAAVELIFHPGIFVALAATSIAFIVVLRLTRDSLHLASTFPEVTRIPVVGRLVR